MPTKEKLLNNARRFQKRGKSGDAIKLYILANEVRTIRDAPPAIQD